MIGQRRATFGATTVRFSCFGLVLGRHCRWLVRSEATGIHSLELHLSLVATCAW